MVERKRLPPEIYNEIREASKKCYSCSKCVSACPVADEMDFSPSLMIKLAALGNFDRILASNAIWVCSSCQNCYSRCPFEINIPLIIDTLKEYAHKNNLSHKERATQLFHEIFLSQIRQFGRIHGASFIGKWKISSGRLFSDLALGVKMFLKGKLPIFPEKINGEKEVKELFK